MKQLASSKWLSLVVVGLLAVQLAAEVSGDLTDDLAILFEQGVKLGKLEHPFDQINKELCKQLKTDDYEQNAKLATSWYEEIKDRKMFLLRKQKLRAMALELLTEGERQRWAGTWCRGERVEELARWNKREVSQHVASLRRKQPKGMLMCNRVFNIFFEQTLHHLELCAAFYQANLRHTVDQLNEFRLKDVERALEPLIGALEKRLAAVSSQMEPDFDFVQALRRELAGDQLDQELIELSADSMKGLVRFHNADEMDEEEIRDHIFDMISNAIELPCNYLATNLRPTLGPATLDLENLDEFWQGGKQLKHVERDMRSYGADVYKYWTQYLICNKLLELDLPQLGEAVVRKVLEQTSG